MDLSVNNGLEFLPDQTVSDYYDYYGYYDYGCGDAYDYDDHDNTTTGPAFARRE